MANNLPSSIFLLPACHELLDSHPESVRIREQVEALEEAMPDRPGVVVSFCRTIIETTCKTILTDRGVAVRLGVGSAEAGLRSSAVRESRSTRRRRCR